MLTVIYYYIYLVSEYNFQISFYSTLQRKCFVSVGLVKVFSEQGYKTYICENIILLKNYIFFELMCSRH